jgi:hypothetical protein
MPEVLSLLLSVLAPLRHKRFITKHLEARGVEPLSIRVPQGKVQSRLEVIETCHGKNRFKRSGDIVLDLPCVAPQTSCPSSREKGGDFVACDYSAPELLNLIPVFVSNRALDLLSGPGKKLQKLLKAEETS